MKNYEPAAAEAGAVAEMQLGLFGEDPVAGALRPPTITRPLQYLGAKGRAIPAILAQAAALNPHRRAVLDAFSGSSVVSQAFSRAGFPVVANDASAFCAGLARTFLGMGREPLSAETLGGALRFLDTYQAPNARLWADLQATELQLLAQADAHALSAFYLQLPVVWRPGDTPKPLQRFFHYLHSQTNQPASREAGLVAAYYAGSYFGVRQAVEIDCLRHGIEVLTETGRVDAWQRSLLLAALTSTLSAAVHSAGKHFAQPINIGNRDRADILLRRLLDDRQVDIRQAFRHHARKLLAGCHDPLNPPTPHQVLNQPLENLRPDLLPPIGLVYADPPYTAQQYSRFYHVPEVVFAYQYPRLQRVNGSVTSGLYPDDKFKSAFCSKTQAGPSFRRLFELSRELEADLLLSYSVSVSGKTGNDRMISLDQLCALGGHYFGSAPAVINHLDFAYRQLNTGGAALVERQDKEILLSFSTRDK